MADRAARRNAPRSAAEAERRAVRAEAARGRRLRRRRFDDLGLRRGLSERLLPGLVAAMAFLAALALAGFIAAANLGERWQAGAGSSLIVQVPQPGEPASPSAMTRRESVLGFLRAATGVREVHVLSEGELSDLLRPWLGPAGEALSVPLPAVMTLHLAPGADLPALRAGLAQAADGTLIEDQDQFVARLTALAHSLQASAGLAMLVVIGVAASVVAVATRAGIAARREAIEIVHGLGATDAYIAGRFAGRAGKLALIGGAIGALAALPLLLELARIAAPFGSAGAGIAAAPKVAGAAAAAAAMALPAPLWIALPCLPAGAGAIGWLTAQFSVRHWLRRLT